MTLRTYRNPEGLFASWLAGYTRGHQSFKGSAARRLGEERLARALTCVREDGARWRPFPRAVVSPKVWADIQRADARRERVAVGGVG